MKRQIWLEYKKMWNKVTRVSVIAMFHPAHFKEAVLIERFVFIGNLAVPYFVAVIVLTLLYAAVFGGTTRLFSKRYGI